MSAQHIPSGGSTPAIPQATVRMYRLPSLGDCFLLRLPSGKDRPLFIQVDFGVRFVSRTHKQMCRIAADIQTTTGGVLDVVALSKGHIDHISGFRQAKEIFETIVIRQAWLCWRDDPDNAFGRQIAQRLQQYTEFLIPSLRRALKGQSAAGREGQKLSKEFTNLGQFLRYQPGLTVEEVINYVRYRAASVLYPSAGEVLNLGSVRVYHLGPPHLAPDQGYLGMVSGLLVRMGLDKEQAMDYTLQLLSLFPTPEKVTPQERILLKRIQPFDLTDAIPLRDAPNSLYQDFFLAHYGSARSEEQAPKWRRIAPDWLEPAKFLLQQLHQLLAITNQAMAFELVESGKVLLFPGDSQESDWLLWQSLKWKLPDGNVVTFKDLLSRTVLYKVGQHGSRIGTLLEPGGLSWMTNPKLVALLPTYEGVYNNIPYKPLLQRLLKVTRGRVLRMDHEMPERPANIPVEEWMQFEDNVRFDPNGLWIEYDI